MKNCIDSIDAYQAILYDFDGVLAESMNVKTEAFQTMFQPFGDEIVEKIVQHHIEHGGISRYKKLYYYYETYLNKSLTEQQLNDLAQQFSDIVVDKVISSSWVPGVKEFLEQFYQTNDFYVVSGTPQQELNLVVKNRNMEKYFKGVYGSPDTKPDIIQRIINANNYDQDAVIYIGDSLSDYEAAQKAKVPFLGRVPKDTTSMFPKSVHIITDFLEVLK